MRKTQITMGLCLLIAAGTVTADTYTIDPTHTFPRWRASHFGFSTHQGQFNKTAGKITLDPKAGKGGADITIDATSINTGDPKMEAHLKSADFFNVEKFPTMTFKSGAMQFKAGQPVSVTGDFTLLGVTKPVTFAINNPKCGMHPIAKKEACGADLTGTIKRSDFGMKYGIPGVSDEVQLTIQVEAYKD